MSGSLVVAALMSVMTTPVATSSQSVVLGAGALDEELRPHLVRELGPRVVGARTDAHDLSVVLRETDDALELVLADAVGEVLRRRIPLDSGRVAAFRAVVLAVEQALTVLAPDPLPTQSPPPPDGPRAAAPAPVAPSRPTTSTTAPPWPPKSAGPSVRAVPTPVEKGSASTVTVVAARNATVAPALFVSAGPAATWAGGVPQVGAAIDVQYEHSRFRLGGTLAFHGVCCAAVVDSGGATALDGDIQSIFALATTTWWLLRRPVDVGATAAVGAERLRLRVVPRIFVGTPSTTESVRWSAQIRLGVAVGGRIAGPLRWRLAAGAFARSHAPRLGLPAGFPLAAQDLEVGRFGPFGAIALEWKLF